MDPEDYDDRPDSDQSGLPEDSIEHRWSRHQLEGIAIEAIDLACHDTEGDVGRITIKARAIAAIMVAQALASVAGTLEAGALAMRKTVVNTGNEMQDSIARYQLDSQAALLDVVAAALKEP